MFLPNVVGQSGTAIPESVLVTSPPINNSGTVANVVSTANRWGHGEGDSRFSEEVSIIDLMRGNCSRAKETILWQPILGYQW